MNDNYWSKQAINKRLFKLDKQYSNNPTVTLLSGEKVKVDLNYLAEFLEDNKAAIKVQKVKRKGSMNFTKEILQDFIANYSAPFHPLTDDCWQQAYNQGSAEVLQSLEATFLSDNPHVGTTLDSYLESDELIDQCIQQAKDKLAKIKNLSKEDSDRWEQYLQSISVPGTIIF